MIAYNITPRALQIASAYWGVPWWELTADEIAEAVEAHLMRARGCKVCSVI